MKKIIISFLLFLDLYARAQVNIDLETAKPRKHGIICTLRYASNEPPFYEDPLIIGMVGFVVISSILLYKYRIKNIN